MFFWLTSPPRETSTVFMSEAAQGQVPVCLSLCKWSRNTSPSSLLFQSQRLTNSHLQKKPLPHNEMWNIISRVGTRQFQNPPSDVFFLSLSVFHHVFVLSIFPLRLPVSPSLCAKHCFHEMGVPQLLRVWGINEMLSPQIIYHSPEEKNIRMHQGQFFVCLRLLRYDVVTCCQD